MKNKGVFLIVIFIFIFSSFFAQTDWYVSETGDDLLGNGSEASPWATISKALGTGTPIEDGDTINIIGTITDNGNAEAGINILKDITIQGNSKETSIVQAATESGIASSRVFTIWGIVKIKNLTIRNGYLSGFSSNYGAGILNWGSLIIENCDVTENQNLNPELGGGIYNEFGNLYIKDTYIYSNFSEYGGAGIVTEGGSLNIENSTIALNYTQHNLAKGAGILIRDTADVNITNSTIYYNLHANNSFGAGIAIIEDDEHTGTVNLNLLNTTIAENEAGDGSEGIGIYIANNSNNSVIVLMKNCILSNGNSNNYKQVLGSGSVNLTRTNSICIDESLPYGNINGNINDTDPQINTFLNHGGLTKTASLLETSPAINAGTDVGAPITDQRGMPRSGIADMGAYEFQAEESVNNIYDSRIKLYPNILSDKITVEIIDDLKNINIEIADVSGKNIYKRNLTKKKTSIDLSKFSNGIYFVKIFKFNTVISVKKIVKQ